ncbi:dethiobiotin synthase [Luteibacter rhizovicinus]|uniref:ATP-dependent dethiobiotin synthetase BioD n=1 Tax=Luteibacter rhizovicinus TaxID=242606 RepID=A0A4R3YUJ0_9GAMM|nr:dethiobiotin synthase [Luteibacter rhizovicinus]TCV96122.1 dethiobiotin synthase [Luteibacter rhizovicinus]
MQSLFIAGTDTGIGKTHAACALIHALRARGHSVAGMKPVASGCERTVDGLRNDDALALLAASSPVPPYERVNPVALEEAVAPHLAAAHAGISIELPPLRAAFEALAVDHEWAVVEGVGGWMVPLSPTLCASDIAREWRLPVILVVGLRLGCISHARLTALAIQADGCELVGWIANTIDPDMALRDENLQTLVDLLPAPCLGVIPYGVSPRDAAALLDIAVLA